MNRKHNNEYLCFSMPKEEFEKIVDIEKYVEDVRIKQRR